MGEPKSQRAADEEAEARRYADGIERGDLDWTAVNAEIIAKWSVTALLRVKRRAWQVVEDRAYEEARNTPPDRAQPLRSPWSRPDVEQGGARDMVNPQAPLTEAGRALLEREAYNSRSFAIIRPADIAAVEQQAAANERARLAALVEVIDANDACYCEADRSLRIDEVYVSRESVLRLLQSGRRS